MLDESALMRQAHSVVFRSLDGIRLAGTLVIPVSEPAAVTVLVHGGGVTRDEGGFFTRLADGMAANGIASLRFDLRGHGESEGRQEDLTISGILNDIRAAVTHAKSVSGATKANILGASFGGGISAYYAALHGPDTSKLVLINPLVNYKLRFIDSKPYWNDEQIDEVAGRELLENGYLAHSPSFKLGRPLLNEVFYLRPDLAVSNVAVPTLVIHGTADTFIPVQSSRNLVEEIGANAELIEIDGAQHGIAMHDDPQYQNPQTQVWQSATINAISRWLA